MKKKKETQTNYTRVERINFYARKLYGCIKNKADDQITYAMLKKILYLSDEKYQDWNDTVKKELKAKKTG